MLVIECPWCAGSAPVEVAEGDPFECSGCSIQVEIAPDPIGELVAWAA
jgi:hypothetical protein